MNYGLRVALRMTPSMSADMKPTVRERRPASEPLEEQHELVIVLQRP